MNVLITPDSFKESLSANKVADAIERGFARVFPDANFTKIGLGDGGEGTADILVSAMGGTTVTTLAHDPLRRLKQCRYGKVNLPSGEAAVIEIASASGLEGITPTERDPLNSNSFGTGELILDALNNGIRNFFIGLGGSATNDGGAGLLQALGAEFYCGNDQLSYINPIDFERITRIDLSGLDKRLADSHFTVICDVTNPLLGPQGASEIFGPQKGASRETVRKLDIALAHYADLLEDVTSFEARNAEGAGAAGGAGFGLLTVLRADLRRGTEVVLDSLKIDEHILAADLIITGEGCFDAQSERGKAPLGIAARASKRGKPVILISGVLGEHETKCDHPEIDAIFPSIAKLSEPEEAFRHASHNLERTACEIAKTLRLGMSLSLNY